MTAQISAYGRLVADPQLKTTSKGTQMAMASMAVPLPCNQADDGTATMWLSVLAFGKKGQQGQATDALNRAKQQTGQHDDPYGDGIPF
ncbi:TPA: single-stranded DNA-binding protein [Escherichia coli]